MTEESLSGGVNWKLRPDTVVKKINDAYLGPRPDVDTFANYEKLLEGCRGSYLGLEKMRNVYNCLEYLDRQQGDYLFIPESRPSEIDPYYPAVSDAAPSTETSQGECSGPIQLYHTYWTGPSTWRVEFFVKGYLYTQNLPCSRLYIWLESDTNPKAVEDMRNDPGFARFMPLVERGDIVLKAWHFPSRIPIPRETIEADPLYARYLTKDGKLAPLPAGKDELYIGDGVVLTKDGSTWIVLTERQMTFLPVAVSDAVRFVVLHIYGGIYFDMDVLMLRDMRPLVLPPDHNFAERWAVHSHPGDFNTAVMALTANSSISSYLVRGGVRMGLNFHPRIIGRMAWKDGRVEEFTMFETGLFDPIWGEFNWGREGRCTVPCFKDYGVAFLGTKGAIKDEWQSYDGKPLELKPEFEHTGSELRRRGSTEKDKEDPEPELVLESEYDSPFHVAVEQTSTVDTTYGGKRYVLSEDQYPPNNRTLENFFRGAWTYHIHNQWLKHPQPNSWFHVIQRAHDGFFAGERSNPYGEKWTGPKIATYQRWPEFD
ncbi:hypothetical protein EX30DRAFT_301208 [Ascodesmis nigricans]|uniref:SnoRNA binding protein n=1 Tax=Ascodesmis nigricans TaxID=341454 RepID=A0A4S2N595_9PEZI|nr:hypothetical protein EX30DRAFT_301208 [Ascodesmis nigricans]